jgi:hypothetical protein
MKSLRDYLAEAEYSAENPVPGDYFDIEIDTDTLIETVVTEIQEDGSIIIDLDEHAEEIMTKAGYVFENSNMPVANDSTSPINGDEGVMSPIHGNAFAPYHRKHDPREWFRQDIDHEDEEKINEAKYRGREVPLGKKMAGDVKKSKVYVRKPNGNIVKVNFGDKKMRIKKSNPKRRKSFRARHNCANPGPRWKARYWSCRSW